MREEIIKILKEEVHYTTFEGHIEPVISADEDDIEELAEKLMGAIYKNITQTIDGER